MTTHQTPAAAASPIATRRPASTPRGGATTPPVAARRLSVLIRGVEFLLPTRYADRPVVSVLRFGPGIAVQVRAVAK